MSEVKRLTLWMVSESGCELEPYSEESPEGRYVLASDYDQLNAKLAACLCASKFAAEIADELKAECDTLRKQLDQTTEECEYLANENVEFKLMIFNLRKQLDEANAALGSKNARIAEFAERHLSDFAELERLDKQLDEARELLDRTITQVGRTISDNLRANIDAWLEANK